VKIGVLQLSQMAPGTEFLTMFGKCKNAKYVFLSVVESQDIKKQKFIRALNVEENTERLIIIHERNSVLVRRVICEK
jgi:hypothetical protein